MENEIYDKNFHRLGYLEKIEYLSYTDRLYECGSFQITCPAVPKNIELLKIGRIVYFEYDIAGIIQSISYMQHSSTNLEIRGNLLDIMLDWRYIYPTIDLYNVMPYTFMEETVKRNFINCDTKRIMPDFELETVNPSGYASVSKQQTGGSVLEFMIEFGPAYGLGFHVGMDRRRKKFIFKVIPGEDHTALNTKGNKKLRFSDDLNNILECDYTRDSEQYRNTALVAGERGDETRVTLLVNETASEQAGWERRELYVDARDLQSTKEVETTDEEGNEITENVEMSAEEYNALLLNRGKEKLADAVEVEAFEAEVNSSSDTQYQYQKDYKLGDKVTAEKKDLGIIVDAQITEIQVIYNKSGYSVVPTIGNPLLSLYSKLRKGGI